jgi:8-oxo-dGTP pyrophosphatase MutT (NUDIX family)
MIDRWKHLGSRPAGDFRIFRLRQDLYRHPLQEATREYVVLEAPGWINVVPVTDEGQVVLIRQYRHGIAAPTLEIPGGMIDGEDGGPADAARREMAEETGYESRALLPLGAVHPNPAFQDNLCHSFLATGATRVGEPRPDPGEVIEVEERDLSEIPGLISSGQITHALVVAAFFWLEQWMRRERGSGLEDGWA